MSTPGHLPTLASAQRHGHSLLQASGLGLCFLQGSSEDCGGHLWSHSPLGLKSVDFGGSYIWRPIFFGTDSVAQTVFKFNRP